MTITSKAGWADWLNKHSTKDTYDSIPDKVTNMCIGHLSAVSRFDKLVNAKNLVLLSQSSLSKKLQATFLHSVVGIPMIPEPCHFVARAGMKFGLGVELQPDSLFNQTVAKYVPSTLDLMKVTTKDEFVNLAAPTTGTKKEAELLRSADAFIS